MTEETEDRKMGQKYSERVRQIRIFLSPFFCPIRPRRLFFIRVIMAIRGFLSSVPAEGRAVLSVVRPFFDCPPKAERPRLTEPP